MRVLWITPKWPYPADDGARVATVNLLRSLAPLGIKVDLLSIVGADERVDTAHAISALGLQSASVVRRPATASGKLGQLMGVARTLLFDRGTPATMRYYHTRAVRRGVADVLAQASLRQWEFVVYDGLHPAAHAANNGLYAMNPSSPLPMIYRAHNCETDIWRRKLAETSSAPIKALLRNQCALVERFERSVLQSAAGVASVSEEDLVKLRELAPELRGAAVTIGQEFTAPLDLADDAAPRIMFLGRLDWHPNRDGLRWFLENVWPHAVARRGNLRLVIAGSGDGGWLDPYLSLPNLDFRGRVPSVDALYGESVLSIVPVFYGSGTRVKAIEASRYGRAMLSTALGVEGLGLAPGHEYLAAETAEEWIAHLCTFDNATLRAVGTRAHETVRKNFDLAASGRAFRALLEAARSGSVARGTRIPAEARA